MLGLLACRLAASCVQRCLRVVVALTAFTAITVAATAFARLTTVALIGLWRGNVACNLVWHITASVQIADGHLISWRCVVATRALATAVIAATATAGTTFAAIKGCAIL